ncbi:MAG TPA: DUF6624 domain-containing protein [Thermoanaerobaculia bacterium]|jgi:hypothetical protein|nr:DUF6624 domain-containing protein [Thermoanaerobaculia bacterium]
MGDPERRGELLKVLIAMSERDEAAHATVGGPELASDPHLASVHRRMAEEFTEIVASHGWPDRDVAGEEGARIAWMIVYHLIDQPDFVRAMFLRLEDVQREGRIEPWRVAMIEDRIRASEGRLQKYGTRFGWSEAGEVCPDPPIEDPMNVDGLRRKVGLSSLEEELSRRRRAAQDRPAPSPQTIAERRRLFEELSRAAGWRKA